MSNRFSSGKHSIADCDVCGQRYKLKELKELIIKTKKTNILACPECWSPDHPQLQLGMYPVEDPQAVRRPRPDPTYRQSGTLANGSLGGGSRVFQWGWNPVGGASQFDAGMTPNDLVLASYLGTVEVIAT